MIMLVRRFRLGDEHALWRVFHSAIHLIAARDYTSDQIRVWAPDDVDPTVWRRRMEAINPFVVEQDGQIVGYADLQVRELTPDISLTAQPFFARHGLVSSSIELLSKGASSYQMLGCARRLATPLRLNPSLVRTSTGMALGPRIALVYAASRGPAPCRWRPLRSKLGA
jgi:hypothetical protein